jgi:hypothetical protein
MPPWKKEIYKVISPIEIAIIVTVAAVGISGKYYRDARKMLSDAEARGRMAKREIEDLRDALHLEFTDAIMKVASSADFLATSAHTVSTAATSLASIVARHETTVATSLKEAIASSILTTRPATAVELKQHGR